MRSHVPVVKIFAIGAQDVRDHRKNFAFAPTAAPAFRASLVRQENQAIT